MRSGIFELNGPLPRLSEPHAVAMLRPWVDAGSVGALTLMELEQQFQTRTLATLSRPGMFYDFTRYRPTVHLRKGVRQLAVPNTVVNLAVPPNGPELVLVKMLEPHMFAEMYIDSVLQLLRALGVRRYLWVGSMYDSVPHTRPLLISGGAAGMTVERDAERLGIRPSDYQGPSTVIYQMVQRAPSMGIESMWCIVHLPQYHQTEENYCGKVRLMQVMQDLYGATIDPVDLDRAREQNAAMDLALVGKPGLTRVVAQLERKYDAKLRGESHNTSSLSPEVVQFLNHLGSGREEAQ